MSEEAETNAPAVLGIVGPTASGKSDLALAVAKVLPLEILVADSRQVYRGMDVGTAKPPASARAAVPHHLIDLVEPDQRFTVADWVRRARALVPEVAARGRLPLIVGGSGLYVAALVGGHDYAGQPADAALRARLADELGSGGFEPLVSRLTDVAPEVAAVTDLRNPRRVLRALERALGGGVEPARDAYAGAVTLIGLERPREVLYRRIDARAEWLFANGLLDEVRALMAAGHGPQLRPMTGHGYAEAMRHLAGEWTLEEAIDRTARRTRQYAKRQLTWFRHQADVAWIDAGDHPGDDPALLTQAIGLLEPGIGAHRLP